MRPSSKHLRCCHLALCVPVLTYVSAIVFVFGHKSALADNSCLWGLQFFSHFLFFSCFFPCSFLNLRGCWPIPCVV